MFRLTEEEWRRSQIVTSAEWEIEVPDSQSDENSPPIVMSSKKERISQIVISSEGSGKTKFRKKGALPYAFTEHGVSMLASVLRSEKAVQMSIAIVRAFIALKQYVAKGEELAQQLRVILDRLNEHDVQLNAIYDVIENLLDEKVEEKAEEKKWVDRERVGFKK
jgi:phage regulator Rha-like protein